MADSKPPAHTGEQESQRLWQLAAMGGTLASEILAGALLGWCLDALFGSKPTCLIVGTILGVVVGLSTFIRRATAETRRGGREGRDIGVRLAEEKRAAARAAAEARRHRAGNQDEPGAAPDAETHPGDGGDREPARE